MRELQQLIAIEERTRVQTRAVRTAYSLSHPFFRPVTIREKAPSKLNMHHPSYPALHTGASRSRSRRRATASERTRTVHAGAQPPTRALCRHGTRGPNARCLDYDRELIRIVVVISPVVRPSPCHQSKSEPQPERSGWRWPGGGEREMAAAAAQSVSSVERVAALYDSTPVP